ncbi:MAG TPA: hypothetical protein VFF69_10930 [Phycisphaerales bacterium]|nr:hypothetical protein [Phycisphaerales bacterium]
MIVSSYSILCSLPLIVIYSASCTIRRGNRRSVADVLLIAWSVAYAAVQMPTASLMGAVAEQVSWGQEGWTGVPLSVLVTSGVTAGILGFATRSRGLVLATILASVPAALLLVDPGTAKVIAAPVTWHAIVGSAILFHVARNRPTKAGVCPHCGYSLEGLHFAAPCPECGRGAVAEAAP